MGPTLDRAVEASEIVDALKPFGVTQRDVAAVTHVSDRAVRGWRTSDIRSDRYDRLAQLRDLLLEGKRPVDLLAEDRYETVRVAAEAFVGGAYV